MLRPTVKDVKVLENYELLLNFDNGEKGIFDVKPYISGSWYGMLKDKSYFASVSANGFCIEWAEGQDICPDDLYYASKKIKD